MKCFLSFQRNKEMKEMKEMIPESYQGTAISLEHEGDGDTNYNGCAWNVAQKHRKKLEEPEARGITDTIQTIPL